MISLLKNCLLSNNKKVDILIKDDTIIKVSEDSIIIEELEFNVDQVFDIKKNLVMPGIIDGYSRCINKSGYNQSDYNSESIACAYGGITTFVDVPTTPYSSSYVNELKEKIEDANKNSIVNFAFAVSASDSIDDKELLSVQNYVVGTIFTLHSRDFKERIQDSISLKKKIKCSKLIIVHLSGNDIDTFFTICDNKNVKILFYDITNEVDLEKINHYKFNEGYNISTSTSIMYLLFNKDHLDNEYKKKTLTTDFKLGTMLNNIGMWNAIKNGRIDMVTSSHIPVSIIEKFETDKLGVPNFETLFSILFDNFYYKKIPITILEKLLSTNPAKIYGMKNKGEIKEGYDADLIIINTTKRWWIKNDDIVSSARWTPFNDYRISGRVMMTFVNGELIYNYINQMCPIRKIKSSRMARLT